MRTHYMGRGQWVSLDEPQIVASFPWLQTPHWDHSGLFCLGEWQTPSSSPSVLGSHIGSQTAGSSPYVASQPHSALTEPSSGELLTAPFDWLLTVRLGLLSSSLLTLKDDYFSFFFFFRVFVTTCRQKQVI